MFDQFDTSGVYRDNIVTSATTPYVNNGTGKDAGGTTSPDSNRRLPPGPSRPGGVISRLAAEDSLIRRG